MRYKVTLSYDGSPFNGWQIQPSAPSVQQLLEQALSTLLRSQVQVTGAGRTDTGVNASSYVAHFDFPAELDAVETGYKLNAILPSSTVIHSIEKVGEDFHARFSATGREYTYFLHRAKDPFISDYSFLFTYPLDFKAMNEAAMALTGTHDFSCFEKSGADSKTSICTVREAYWAEYEPTHVSVMGFRAPVLNRPDLEEESLYWYFRICADRFLRNMVRAVVGTLLDVGRGKRTVEEFKSLILPPDKSGMTKDSSRRCLAGESVPGNALFLSHVDY